MKKEYIITTAVIVILVLLGGIFVSQSQTDSQESKETGIVEEITLDEIERAQEMGDASEKVNQNDKAEMMEAPETASVYILSDSTEVSYTAQKRFLQKADDVVVGVTTEVSGSGWYDFESATGSIDTSLDFSNIATDNAKRDSDLTNMLDDTTIDFHTDISNLQIDDTGAFQSEVPAELTFNGVTNTVLFNVTGNLTENTLTAQGTTTVNMSDFGINPPSIVGVYTVDDAIELSFNVNAISSAE